MKLCPICQVESPGGRVCSYHKRAMKKHEEEAAIYRAKYYTQVLVEYVDEARQSHDTRRKN